MYRCWAAGDSVELSNLLLWQPVLAPESMCLLPSERGLLHGKKN
jgi:hypothetical protein